jgi:hypothetical protein
MGSATDAIRGKTRERVMKKLVLIPRARGFRMEDLDRNLYKF